LAAGRSGLKRGDVVTIATGGGFGGKPRPAVIVQSDEFADIPTLVVAPFTSELSGAHVLRLRFQPDSGNGLREASDLMTDILVTARRDQVGSVIGTLTPEDMVRIERALLVMLGLAG
jgi:mRNA interferase MazF